MEKRLVCIVCPSGCVMTACRGPDGISVAGNNCKRGAEHAVSEMTDPRRTVTAVVRSNSERLPFVPVRTDTPLPKNLVFKLLRRLYAMELTVPVRLNDVIIHNFEGSGVNVKTTRTAEL
jgi:CxxC motif-containing protein